MNGAAGNLPAEYLERMKQMLGNDFPAFLRSYEEPRTRGLRINRLKDPAGLSAGLPQMKAFGLRPVPWELDGYYYSEDAAPGRSPLHEAGVFYIQEPSAMAVVPLLEAGPGDRVLDLCAAPGGKSTQIASYLRGKGLLVSNEIHPERARALSGNIERMGIANAVVTSMAPDKLAQAFPAYFDRILVDAPCSGEGMFRKDPGAVAEWSTENVRMCADRQRDILREAASMLKAGGRLVYSTCTFSPEEDEEQVRRFLEERGDLSLLCMKKLYPHEIEGEGHFAAVFVKEGGTSGASGAGWGPAASGREKKSRISGPMADALKLWEQFYREYFDGPRSPAMFSRTLTDLENVQPVLFGDALYLAPAGFRTDGIRILRAGLHLGTVCRGRFEPSHALAMALEKEAAGQAFELIPENGEEGTAYRYLSGESIFCGEDGGCPAGTLRKGWVLMTVCGFSAGWGKYAGGQIKNHYPKGLRRALQPEGEF